MPCAAQAILFDLGGTLDAPGIPWKERLFRLYRGENVDVAPERFTEMFYRVDDGLVGTVEPALSLRETVQRLVAGVSRAVGVADPEVTERIETRFYIDSMTYARRSAPLLAQLAERYRLGVVSNFYGNLTTVCAELGLGQYMNVIVDSAEVGWVKPDARIFGHALDRLRVSPAASTFVGDSPLRDMAGARAIGMPLIWLAGDTGASVEPCCPGDTVIRTLDTLRVLLL